MKRLAPFTASLVCIVVGAALVVLASDVARWQDALRSSDARYRNRPAAELWAPATVAPRGLTKAVLGLGGDVDYRFAVRALRLSRPETPGISDPAVVVERNEATARLTDIVKNGNDAERRSLAANLLGVLSYSDAIADYTNRSRLVAAAAGRFRQAIAIDPGNEDAKHNLELALSLARGISLSESGGGTNPSPGGQGSKGAGAGDPGSGY